MKVTKIFMMAALAVMTAACSNDDNDLGQQSAGVNGEITITATLEAADGAKTRALSDPDGENKIQSTWETTDQFAILYKNGTEDTKSIATVKSINASTVTITFTIPATLADNTACKIVYPASAANAANTDADVATALATQDGVLATAPDIRVGTATINKTTHSLESVTKLAPQNAIFKFTIQDLGGTAKSASEFVVSDNAGNIITTVTLATAASEFYVALPELTAGTYWFSATADSKPYIAKATATATSAGKYYQTAVKMTTLGDVILSDGKFAKVGSSGTVAKIAYVGSDNGEASPYNHGLALAMSDAENYLKWHTTDINASHTGQNDSDFEEEGGLQYNTTHNGDIDNYPAFKAAIANNNTAVPTGCSAWFLASGYQWKKIINGYGLSNLKTSADGYTGLEEVFYWSSTEYGSDARRVWRFKPESVANWGHDNMSSSFRVRSCLAF